MSKNGKMPYFKSTVSDTLRGNLEFDMSRQLTKIDPNAESVVIVKVHRADYVPDYLRVRARLDSKHFTASIFNRDVPLLNSDTEVEVASFSKLI